MKSDVFKAMLYTNTFTEKLTGSVQVDDIDAKTMKTLLKYMYQNKITCEEVTDLDVLIAADKYNIVDLAAKCEKYILLNLSRRNIMDVLAITKLIPSSKIFEKAMLFFNKKNYAKNLHLGQRWMQLKSQNSDLAFEILESRFNMKRCTEKEGEEAEDDESDESE
jgi:hypothetical protein